VLLFVHAKNLPVVNRIISYEQRIYDMITTKLESSIFQERAIIRRYIVLNLLVMGQIYDEASYGHF
jgi:hypothetical protein